MISDPPIDVLADLKAKLSDPRKPISVMRQDFSAFYEEMGADDGEPAGIESVEITKVLQGYWITVPEAVTRSHNPFFPWGRVQFWIYQRSPGTVYPNRPGFPCTSLFDRVPAGT